MQQAWEFSHPRFIQGKSLEYYTSNIRRRTAADFTPSHLELDSYRTEIMTLREQLARQDRLLAMKDNELALARRTMDHQAAELYKTRQTLASLRGSVTSAPQTPLPALPPPPSTAGLFASGPPARPFPQRHTHTMQPSAFTGEPPSTSLAMDRGMKRARNGLSMDTAMAARQAPVGTSTAPPPWSPPAAAPTPFDSDVLIARAPSVDSASLGGGGGLGALPPGLPQGQPTSDVAAVTGLGLLASAGSLAESSSIAGSAPGCDAAFGSAPSAPGDTSMPFTAGPGPVAHQQVQTSRRDGGTPTRRAPSTTSWSASELDGGMWAALDESLRVGPDAGDWTDEFNAAVVVPSRRPTPSAASSGHPAEPAPPGHATTTAALATQLAAFTPSSLAKATRTPSATAMLCTGEDVCTTLASVSKLQAYVLSLPGQQQTSLVRQLLLRTAQGLPTQALHPDTATAPVPASTAAAAIRCVTQDSVATRFAHTAAGTPLAQGAAAPGASDPKALARMASAFPPRFLLACLLPLAVTQGIVLGCSTPLPSSSGSTPTVPSAGLLPGKQPAQSLVWA